MEFPVLNSYDSFSKEKELDCVDLSSTNVQEKKSAIKEQLNYQYKNMSDKNKEFLDHNNFPQIPDIQACIAETETRILEAFEKGSETESQNRKI